MDKYQYAELLRRIEKLEKWAHPAKDLCEFSDYQQLDERIKKLEEKQNGEDNNN